jgi:hypothetical protein
MPMDRHNLIKSLGTNPGWRSSDCGTDLWLAPRDKLALHRDPDAGHLFSVARGRHFQFCCIVQYSSADLSPEQLLLG